VIYRLTKGLVLRLLRTPEGPPEPPAGSEASLRVFRASPRFLTYRLLLLLGLAGILWLVWGGLLVAALTEGRAELWIVVCALAVLLLCVQAVAYFCLHVDYDLRYYVLTDRSLRVRQGALTVQEMTLTHANVQNLRLVQGPIQRLLGIQDLEVDTAGGGTSHPHQEKPSGHSVRLAGIDNASEVRDTILAHLRHHGRDAGLGDPDDARTPGGPAPAALQAALLAVREAARGLREAAQRTGP